MQTGSSQSHLLWESVEEVIRYQQSMKNGLKGRGGAPQAREGLTKIVRGYGKLASKFSGSNQPDLLVVKKLPERLTKGIWTETKGAHKPIYNLKCVRD